MADLLRVVACHMSSLVTGLGCLDAAAETINARWGGRASKGTLSKKLNGALDWTLADVIAIEDALGRWPVTRLLAQRVGRIETGVVSLTEQAGLIARENGEALQAMLAAVQSCAAADVASAIKETDEAIEALQQGRAKLVDWHEREGA